MAFAAHRSVGPGARVLDEHTTIDLIYEAALEPHLWSEVLDKVSVLVGARGGVLFAVDPAIVRWVSSSALETGMRDFVGEGWLERNTRTPRLASLGHPGYLTDEDIFSPSEMANEPIYKDFLWPRGLLHGAASIIMGPGFDTLVMSFEGFGQAALAQAAKPGLDRLRPHFARAGLVAAKLGLAKAEAAAAALEGLGLAAAVVTSQGRPLAINSLLESAGFDLARWGAGRLRLADAAADARLAQALARGQLNTSIPVRTPGTLTRHVAHLLPLKGRGQDVLLGGAALLVFCPVGARARPAVDLISVLYDLTPAEARVGALVAEGMSAPNAARVLGSSVHTVRHHLKAIFAKTCTTSQVELAALLAPSLEIPVSPRS